jgi:large subunit ribosomal protein L21
MFAIVEISGKQHKVETGDVLKVEKIRDHKVGDKIKTDRVLLRAEGAKAEIGMPYVAGASVGFEIKEFGRGEKIRVFKKKAKKRYVRTQGHRQDYTRIEITEVK